MSDKRLTTKHKKKAIKQTITDDEWEEMSVPELVRHFELLMDDMNLSEEKRKPLREQDTDQIRRMLRLNVRRKTALITLNPHLVVKSLNDWKAKPDFLKKVRVNLSTNQLSWIKTFGLAGLKGLINAMKKSLPKDVLNATEAVRCIYFFINSQYGMEEALSMEEFVYSLYGGFHMGDDDFKYEVMRILAAITLYPNGHGVVLRDITAFAEKTGVGRLAGVVGEISANHNPTLSAICLQFINALVGTPDDWEFRQHLRAEVLRLGLGDVLTKLKDSTNQDLQTHSQLFLELMKNDYSEFESSLRDTAEHHHSLESCLEALKSCRDLRIVSILQHIIFVSNEPIIRDLYLTMIEMCVGQIVIGKNGIDPDPAYCALKIDIEPVIAAFEGKLVQAERDLERTVGEYDTKLSAAITGKTEAETKVDILQERVTEYDNKLNAAITGKTEAETRVDVLQERVRELEASTIAGDGTCAVDQGGTALAEMEFAPSFVQPPAFGEKAPPAGRTVPAPPPPLFGAKVPAPPPPFMGGNAPQQSRSVPAPPPPLFGGKVPAPPPSLMGGKIPAPPPPLMGGKVPAPPPPLMGGKVPAPPPPLIGGKTGPGVPPPPTALAGAAPPPPMGGVPPPMNAAPAEPPFGMKRKPVYPKSQPVTKRINWTKMQLNKIKEDSVWTKLDDGEFADDEIQQNTVNMFKNKIIDKPTAQPQAVIKELKLLDSKTAQNLSILFGQMRKSPSQLKTAFLTLDPAILKATVVEQFIKNIPEKLDSLREEPFEDLQECEQNLSVLAEVSSVRLRLDCMQISHQYPDLLSESKTSIASVTDACSQVLKCDRLVKVLQLVLCVGNILNANSRNAETFAFDLKFLTKLRDTKSSDNSMNLLNYLANVADKKCPEVLDFHSDLTSSSKAALVKIDDVDTLADQMKKFHTKITRGLESHDSDEPGDKFTTIFGTLGEEMEKQIILLDKMRQTMKEAYQKVADYFSFTPKSLPSHEFFSIISTFAYQFNEAVQVNRKAKMLQEKNERMRLAKERAEEEKRKNVVHGDEGVVDSLLEALKSGQVLNKPARRRRPQMIQIANCG